MGRPIRLDRYETVGSMWTPCGMLAEAYYRPTIGRVWDLK